ncbi:MAG: hypothetical protein ACYTXF_24575 [Nostoc sp.]
MQDNAPSPHLPSARGDTPLNRSKHPRHCFYAPARKHPVVTREAIAVTSLPSGDIYDVCTLT